MDPIVEVSGVQLGQLLDALSDGPVISLRVAIDDGGVKVKINNGIWSPPLGTIDRPLDERIVDALVAGDLPTARALYIEETNLLGEEQQ